MVECKIILEKLTSALGENTALFLTKEPDPFCLLVSSTTAGVYEFFDIMRQRIPELDIKYWVVDGGYSRPGDDGMPRRKSYNIGIKTPEGVDIFGMLHCDAAGTVENPFEAYDMTLLLN